MRSARHRPRVLRIQSIMEVLDEVDGTNLNQLALYTNTNYVKLRNTVKEMVKTGLVDQRRSNQSKRVNYSLTNTGRQVFCKLREYTTSLSSMGLPPI